MTTRLLAPMTSTLRRASRVGGLPALVAGWLVALVLLGPGVAQADEPRPLGPLEPLPQGREVTPPARQPAPPVRAPQPPLRQPAPPVPQPTTRPPVTLPPTTVPPVTRPGTIPVPYGTTPVRPPPPAWPPSGPAPAVPQPGVALPGPSTPGPVRPVLPAPTVPAGPLVGDPILDGGMVPGVAQPEPPIPQPMPQPAPVRRPGDPQPIIERIEFVGTVIYSPESLKVLLRNKEGRPLDEVALDADTDTLFQYFQEVQIREIPTPRGVILRIRVAENPMVTRLTIRGAAEIDESEVRGLMRTRAGYPLNPYHLREDAEDIAAAYRLRGFPFAQVPEPTITRSGNGGRRIDLVIVEGPQVKVRSVIFRGNHTLPARELREVMVVKEPSVAESIFGGGLFREDALQEDVVAIKERYRREGFLDVEAALADLRYSDDKSEVDVVIQIVEHDAYRVGLIRVEMNAYEDNPELAARGVDRAHFSEANIRTWLGVQSGERLSGKQIEEGLEKIRDEYYQRSYLETQVGAPKLRARGNENVVDVTLTINEGPKLRIGRINVVGNEYTRDKIIRREIKLSPGGYIDRRELERGEARVRGLGYFDRVSMRLEDAIGPDGQPVPGVKDATYEINEGSTGNVTFAAGLSTSGGLFGNVTYTKRNFDITRWPRSFADLGDRRTFTGAGQQLTVFLQPSTIESQFEVRFREPRLFGSLWGFDAAVYKRLVAFDDFLVDRTGYRIGFDYPLIQAEDDSQRLSLAVAWRHEWIDISDIDDDAIPGAFLFRKEQELRSVAFRLNHTMSDDIRNPEWVWRANIGYEYAGAALGGQLDFWKLSGGARYGRVLWRDRDGDAYRFRTDARFGLASKLEDTPEVPPYERYYLGGNSFRGFANRGVGPHFGDSSTGGEWFFVHQNEFEVPVVRGTLAVVGFLDWGTLATSIDSDDAFRLRASVGIGLRIVVPIVSNQPLAFDFGFPILSEDEDQKSVVSFSLGRDF